MPVVVNEVEVVPGERKQESGSEEKGGSEQGPPSEHDIRRLVEQQTSRSERVWAY